MNIPAYLAIIAVIAMVVFYSLEGRSQLARLGFSAAALVAALSLFALGRWPFGVVAVGLLDFWQEEVFHLEGSYEATL